MNRFKIKAFYDKYSAAVRCVGGDVGVEATENVAVRDLANILDHTPEHYVATGSLVDVDDSEKMFLLDATGETVGYVKHAFRAQHNEAHCDNEFRNGETVGETVDRVLRGDGTVNAVVGVRTGHRIRNHHSVGGFDVVWYRRNGFDLENWVETRRRETVAEFEHSTDDDLSASAS